LRRRNVYVLPQVDFRKIKKNRPMLETRMSTAQFDFLGCARDVRRHRHCNSAPSIFRMQQGGVCDEASPHCNFSVATPQRHIRSLASVPMPSLAASNERTQSLNFRGASPQARKKVDGAMPTPQADCFFIYLPRRVHFERPSEAQCGHLTPTHPPRRLIVIRHAG